ncbi:MAG: hypothetical protein ACK41T_13035 [Pseudobdellovibrio sp.]
MEKSHGQNKTNKLIANQKGQFAIEAILLMSVLVGIFIAVTNQIKTKGYFYGLFNAPVKSMSNMTGYGTWKNECFGFGKSKQKFKFSHCHPNSIHRVLSSNPEP